MRIVFRADASSQIGSGHVMRCLALADALVALGAQTIFLCRGHGLGALASHITAAGHALVTLPDATESIDSGKAENLPKLAHAHWLPGGWQADASACLNALANHPPSDWLIVDHYALDERWQREMRSAVRRIMVIDDLADRSHDCDLLLDQNYFVDQATRYDRLVPYGCIKLFGPRHVLLRTEFDRARATLRNRDGKVRRVLVFFGGADRENHTQSALAVLHRLAHSELAIDVVTGASNPHRAAIADVCVQRPNTKLFHQVDNIAELMAAADLAVGAGGIATFERCYLRLPTIALATASNQFEPLAALHQLGVIRLVRSMSELADHLAHALTYGVAPPPDIVANGIELVVSSLKALAEPPAALN